MSHAGGAATADLAGDIAHGSMEGNGLGDQPKARVLIYGINFAPEPIGVGRYTTELATYLAATGSIVEVVTGVPHYPGWSLRSGFKNRYSIQRKCDLRIMRCPLLLTKEMRGIARVIAPLSFAIASAPVAFWRILSARPDAVICVEPTLFCAPVALLAATLVGARKILHVQDLEIDAAFAIGHLRSTLLKTIANSFERATLRRFDVIVTISNRMRERLQAKGVSAERLTVIRNWVDIEKILSLRSPSSYRQECNITNDSFVVLYAGNIGAKQALAVVLEAAKKLADRQKIKFIIVGEGPEKRRLMERYGHLPNVQFLPVQPEERLGELLNLANVHVLPQERGAADLVLPSKLGGMLASGKPSIVMADPGTELFDFLGNGAVIVPPGNSAELAAEIERQASGESRNPLEDNSARLALLEARSNLHRFREVIFGGPQPDRMPEIAGNALSGATLRDSA